MDQIKIKPERFHNRAYFLTSEEIDAAGYDSDIGLPPGVFSFLKNHFGDELLIVSTVDEEHLDDVMASVTLEEVLDIEELAKAEERAAGIRKFGLRSDYYRIAGRCYFFTDEELEKAGFDPGQGIPEKVKEWIKSLFHVIGIESVISVKKAELEEAMQNASEE